MTRFRTDNTDGYSVSELAELNQAIEYVIESSCLTDEHDKSAIDHAEANLLAAYDRGVRGWDLIGAAEPPWPYPPSYLTAKGPVR